MLFLKCWVILAVRTDNTTNIRMIFLVAQNATTGMACICHTADLNPASKPNSLGYALTCGLCWDGAKWTPEKD